MIVETYKGRKLRAVPGRGNEWGTTRFTLNGTPMGQWSGTPADVIKSAKVTIDVVDSMPVDGARWSAVWYAPGTFLLCDNGHPRAADVACTHPYCARLTS